MSAQTGSGQRTLVIAFIIIGTLFIVFFGLRVFHAFRQFDGHRPPRPGKVETDVALIRDWMTIPFISRMYQVPDKVIFDALKLSPQKDHEKSLKELNDEYFPDQTGYVLKMVQETILAHQPPTPETAATAIPPLTAPAP